MDKDFDLKNDPRYQTAHLRERVSQNTKSIHDEGEELKENPAKTFSNRKMNRRWKSDWNKNDL